MSIVAAVAVIVSLLRGGRLGHFLQLDLRVPYAIVIAFLLRAGLYTAAAKGMTGLLPYAAALHILAYLLLLWALWQNLHLPGVRWLFSGTVLNALVIVANGGRMPVSEAAMRATDQAHLIPVLKTPVADYIHTIMTSATHLRFLGDNLVLPRPYPFPVTFSPGDLLIATGLVLLASGVMVHRRGLVNVQGM